MACTDSASEPSGSGAGGSAAQGGATSGGSGSSGGAGGAAQGGSAGGGGLGSGGTSTGGTGAVVQDCGVTPPVGVTFSPPSGTFEGSVTVTLTPEVATDVLRYTTDHTAPTASSPTYTGPLTFDASTDLRVQVFTGDSPVGDPTGAVYVERTGDAQHDHPLLVLDSFGTPVPDEGGGFPQQPMERPYIDAAVLGFEPTAGATSLAGTPALATQGAFHVRGQSSASYDKKPYRLELRQANTTDRDCVMFGMPSESDWVLHSPFPDKALIRNAFAYSLGRDMGLAAPRTAFVELYLTTDAGGLDAADYQGVYLLVETIKNQKNRLDLQQLTPMDTMLPDVAGGYIFKFEWQVQDIAQELACPAQGANCWNWLEVVDPEPWVPEQEAYLASYLQQVVTALHSASPADMTTGYPAFIDVASWVNTVIVNELTRNLDAYVRSQFFYKDRDSKLFAGPLWDFDLIAGVGSGMTYGNLETSGWQYESNQTRLEATVDWFPVLLADPTFKASLVARYKELRQSLLSDAQIDARITTLTQGLAAGAARNFQKWNNLTTQQIGFFQTPIDATWEAQVEQMRTWLKARLAWLDTQWV